MSYTTAEREEIARQIKAYAEAGKVHSWQGITMQLSTGPLELEPFEQVKEASTYQLAWLDLTARDVLGLIDHDSLPAELRGVHTARRG